MAAALVLLEVGLLRPVELWAQATPEGAVPVDQRYDPVVGGYRPVVLEPLSASAVRSIQRALAKAGHGPGALTGVLDNLTRVALRDFQSANGLRITGRPDYDTVVALRVPTRRATPAEIVRLGRRYTRPYDVVIIGPGDSLGTERPPIGGVGVMPGGPQAPPQVPGPGVEPAPAPGVTPLPEPGVEPVPAPGVQVIPAPGAPQSPAPGVLILPAPPSAAPPIEPAPPAPSAAPPTLPARPDSTVAGPESIPAR